MRRSVPSCTVFLLQVTTRLQVAAQPPVGFWSRSGAEVCGVKKTNVIVDERRQHKCAGAHEIG